MDPSELPPPSDVAPAHDGAAWVDDTPSYRDQQRALKRPEPGTTVRDTIHIPDFTLIKRIGSGAYGEVWLAQGITGALRAIKIVWREDFELERTFHREFLGIQQFEPISRGHPGLVHILHVGWNEEHGFYYCVMELADDVEVGPHIEDTGTYVPRTLGTDLKRHGRLDLHFCQEAGAFIADALHYMHERGLTHRDIKPSNIIYCGGICKLADIGLVAVTGERSFVGTEGFVPPEGPGTPQADIYSLGKVLYEMTSGKDRMEFPEVPDDIHASEWPFWHNMNRVILRACAPDLKERWATGEVFADALRAVNDQRPVTLTQKLGRWLRQAAVFILGSCFAGGVWASWQHQQQWVYQVPAPARPVPPAPMPPTQGKPWKNSVGLWFSWQKDRHVADAPVDYGWFNTFLEETMRPFEGGVVTMPLGNNKEVLAVVVSKADADDFCDWITHREHEQNDAFPEQYQFDWQPLAPPQEPGAMPLREGWAAMTCTITRVGFGKLIITSTPSPAEVFIADELKGPTPLTLPRVPEGDYEIQVRYPGYKTEVLKGKLKRGETRSLNSKLKNIRAVVWGKPWENTQRLGFVPLGRAMLGIREVSRRDYREYAQAKKLPPVPEQRLDIEAELDLPITYVTRAEAMGFCEWLTEKEQATEIIDSEHRYRLPNDDEWSLAGHAPRAFGATPAQRHLHVDGIYPWGFTTMPPANTANLFDTAAAKASGSKAQVPGYTDGQPGLARVATMKADALGRHDLSGNVWEWVAEDYGGDDATKASWGTARGGSWKTHDRSETLTSYRRALPADQRADDVGFRLILSDGHSAREDE